MTDGKGVLEVFLWGASEEKRTPDLKLPAFSLCNGGHKVREEGKTRKVRKRACVFRP